jgi:capsular exopolysaccharide synthesis family protein
MTVESIFAFLRRRWLPLLLCLAAGTAGGWAQLHASHKEYRSSASVFVNIPAAQDTQEALQGAQLSSQLLQSYAAIVTSRTTAEQVGQQLGLSAPPAAIAHQLSATPEPNTLIIDISAVNADPAQARSLAQTAASVLNDRIGQLEQNRVPSSAVEASILDNATLPTSPVAPRPLRDLIIGLLLGLLGGLALSLAFDALDRSVKMPGEVEQLVSSPALAVIPRIRGRRTLMLTEPSRQNPAAEAYRALRTSLRFVNPDKRTTSLVVTSPAPKDGKSTTAANLAIALARAGQRVVLVDADLRAAGLSKLFGLREGMGLSTVLTGTVELDAALHQVPDFDTLRILPSGLLPPNPSELLGSQRMTALIKTLTAEADVVIFDAPPVLQVTDAVVLSTQVDGSMLVVRHGQTNRGPAAEAARRLAAVEAPVIGFVLNDQPHRSADRYFDTYAAPEVRRVPNSDVAGAHAGADGSALGRLARS